MEELKAVDALDHEEFNDEVDDEIAAETEEEALGVPFGLLGASFLCNVLQYAVFLGLTMVVLVLIRIFAPTMMVPLP